MSDKISAEPQVDSQLDCSVCALKRLAEKVANVYLTEPKPTVSLIRLIQKYGIRYDCEKPMLEMPELRKLNS